MADDGKHGHHYESQDSVELFEKMLKKSLRIDTRYSVLDFQWTRNFLHIFTDNVANAIQISQAYEKSSPMFKIKVILLPDRSVGELTKGICHVGVAPIRKSNNSSSEQVTQILYGESFDALQTLEDWVRIRLHADCYIGWVSRNQVSLFSENGFAEYRSLPKVYVAAKVLPLFEEPRKDSVAIRETVFSSPIAVLDDQGDFVKVKLPDGLSAYVEKAGIINSSPVKNFSVRDLLAMAQTFRGTSYVWGGRSPKGFDCSGFVQTVFRSSGVELPRDADRQFVAGKSVGRKLSNLLPGDLLFFSYDGKKVSHVALYIGENKNFIHSSGFVRVNSFDPKRADFNKKLYSTFIGACRIAQ